MKAEETYRRKDWVFPTQEEKTVVFASFLLKTVKINKYRVQNVTL